MTKIQTIVNRLNDLLPVKKKPKKVKPIIKNTFRRRLRAWDLRNDRRQQQRAFATLPADDTVRICTNCGLEYTGRVCPQCGQAGTWSRFTWRQTILNFLDIWGLGNRPMYRTLHDLFCRPGYMARDYLEGQRQFYFPPFKLLALVVVLLMFISLLPGADFSAHFSKNFLSIIDSSKVSGAWQSMANGLIWFLTFLSGHPLYEWLFIGLIAVICVWVGFHTVSRYNFVETYIFLIFILSQRLICDIPSMLTGGWEYFVTTHSFSPAVSTMCYGILMILRIVLILIAVYTTYLFVLDFKQFYGLKWKSTILRIMLSVLVGIWLTVAVACIMIIPILQEKSELEGFLYIVIALVLVPLCFLLAYRYFSKTEHQVSPSVIKLGKGMMLLVLLLPWVAYGLHEAKINLVLSCLTVIAYVAAVTAFSFLPVILYKRFHNIWIAFIPFYVLVILFLVICLI